MKIETVFLWVWRSALLLALIFIGWQLDEVRSSMPASADALAVWQMSDDIRTIRQKLAPTP